jgi:hypothetical protein
VAIATGLRRTDERTGRTFEMFLCSLLCQDRLSDFWQPVGQPPAFFVEVSGSDTPAQVVCPVSPNTDHTLPMKHDVIDVFEAMETARLSFDESADASFLIFDGPKLLNVAIEASRPKAARS